MVEKKIKKDKALYVLIIVLALFISINFVRDSMSDAKISSIECETGLENCIGGIQYRFLEQPNWFAQANNHGWHEECSKTETTITDTFATKNHGVIVAIRQGEYIDPPVNQGPAVVFTENTTECVEWILKRGAWK